MKSKLITIGIVALIVMGVVGVVTAQSPNGIRGAFAGDTYVRSVFKIVFGDAVSSDVYLTKGAANTLALGPVGAHFGFSAANPDAVGTCTLGTNCAITFTNAYAIAPVCVGTDQTAAAAVKSAPTTTGVTFTGTGTDVIAYQCDANPN